MPKVTFQNIEETIHGLLDTVETLAKENKNLKNQLLQVSWLSFGAPYSTDRETPVRIGDAVSIVDLVGGSFDTSKFRYVKCKVLDVFIDGHIDKKTNKAHTIWKARVLPVGSTVHFVVKCSEIYYKEI